MTSPRVSVITPTYGHRAFIGDCIKSVRDQAFSDWEVIVVDDASQDGTAEAARTAAGTDRRFTILEHDRRAGVDGLVDTYNEALSRARGELVAVLEGDDWWSPERLASQIALFDDRSVVLAYGDCWEVTASGRRIAYIALPVDKHHARTTTAQALRYFATLTSFAANTVLVRRDALERIGGFKRAGPIVDFPTWLELAAHGDFVRVARPLAFWRRHPGSVQWQRQLEIAEAMRDYMTNFVQRSGEIVVRVGLNPKQVVRDVDAAYDRLRPGLPYLDAQYELLVGERRSALRKLRRVAADTNIPAGLRAASVAGMAAGVTSPALFARALRGWRALRRRMDA